MHFPTCLPVLLTVGLAGAAGAGELTVYESGNFAGRSLAVNEAVPSLAPRGFGDRAASAVIGRGTWELCSGTDYRGRCATLGPGRYPDLAAMGLSGGLSSVREVGAEADYRDDGAEATWSGGGNRGRITLYDRAGFAGEPFVADGSQPDLHDQDYSGRTRSLIVQRGEWEVCSDAYYRGRCERFGPGSYPDLGPLAGKASSLRMVGTTPAVSPQPLARAAQGEERGAAAPKPDGPR